jgi:hypothetical protein
MEILDLRFAGIPVSTWFWRIFGILFCRSVYKEFLDWKERRSWKKQFDAKKKIWDEQHVWKSKIVSGVDYGEWVRKDGRPIDPRDWNPVGELLERLGEKGPR